MSMSLEIPSILQSRSFPAWYSRFSISSFVCSPNPNYLISQPPGRRSSSYLKSGCADSYFRVRALLSAASTMRMACVLRARQTTGGCLHAATVTLIQFFVFTVSYSNRLVAISHNAIRLTRRELRKASIIKQITVSSPVLLRQGKSWDFPKGLGRHFL